MHRGLSPASRIDTRRVSPLRTQHNHYDDDSSPTTPDLSFIGRLSGTQRPADSLLLASSPNGGNSILEKLALGASPDERPQPQTTQDIIRETTDPFKLPHRPESLPPRALAPPRQTNAARTLAKSSPSSLRKGRRVSSSLSSQSRQTPVVDTTDLLYNPRTKMYRDTEEELRKLKEDRQKLRSMLLELEMESEGAVRSSAAAELPQLIGQAAATVGREAPDEAAATRSPSSEGARNPQLLHESPASRVSGEPIAATARKERRTDVTSSSPPQSRKGAGQPIKGALPTWTSSATPKSARPNAPAKAVPPFPSSKVRSSSTSSANKSTTASRTSADGLVDGKLKWQLGLRRTPVEVLEAHRSRLVEDINRRRMELASKQHATIAARQQAQLEERARRRAAMGYGVVRATPTSSSETQDQTTSANDPSHRDETDLSRRVSPARNFLTSGTHPASRCLVPPISRLPRSPKPTPSAALPFSDPSTYVSKRTYGAALETLSFCGLSSERYCLSSVSQRLEQLRAATGCMVPATGAPVAGEVTEQLSQRAPLAGPDVIEAFFSIPFLAHQLTAIGSRRPGSTQGEWWHVQHHLHEPTKAGPALTSFRGGTGASNIFDAPVAQSRFVASLAGVSARPASNIRHHDPEGNVAGYRPPRTAEASPAAVQPADPAPLTNVKSRLQSAESDSPPWERGSSSLA